MKKKIFFILLLAMASVSYANTKSVDNKVVDEKVEAVLKSLSLREKIAQIIIISMNSQNRPATKFTQDSLISYEHLGGLIVMDDDLTKSIARVNELQSKSPLPLIVSIDGEWGVAMRYNEYPDYPYQMQLGALTSEELIYQMGRYVGEECKDLNIYMNFAPTVDVNNNPDNPVINTRSLGADKVKVARFGAAYMKGMQDVGIYTSAKHFPGHGDTNVDSHHGMPILTFNRERLEDLELYPFRELIAEDVAMVMVGHLSIPALDSTGTPASISKPIVTGLLKEEMGYKGIVITDALGMKGVSELMEPKEVTLAAYKAGVDILLMPGDVHNSISMIEDYIRSGEGSEEELDEKVRKMLRLKAQAGMFDEGYSPIVDTTNLDVQAHNVEHFALIEQLCKNSMTLVKCDEGALPIKNLAKKKIAYLGYKADKNARAFGEMVKRYADVDTFYHEKGASVQELDAIRKSLKGYDEVILGIHSIDHRPHRNFGIDTLCAEYIAKWSAVQDLIGVYFGSPYALNKLEWHTNFKAFVVAYHNTEINNKAAAQVIFGGIPAQGVLPVATNLYACGYSDNSLGDQLRLEVVTHSSADHYQVKSGKIYGDSLVAADGSVVLNDTRIRIEGSLASKSKMNKVAKALGMTNTEFKKNYFVSTLDDLAKLCYALMNKGVYGGEKCISDSVQEDMLEKLVALYSAKQEDVRYIFPTDKGSLVILMNLYQKDIDFVITK